MKNKKTLLITTLLTLSSLVFGAEKVLICGSGWKSIAQLDRTTNTLDWEHPLADAVEMNSICLTKDGNIAVSNKKNLLVLDKNTKEVLWKFAGEGKSEIHSVSLLENGNLLVGMCALPAKIIELDNKGNVVKSVEFDAGIASIHPQFRQIILADNGNYIVPLYSGRAFLEINDKGEILEKVDMPIALFSVMKLKNGNYLLSGEAGKGNKETARIVEYDPKAKKIVSTTAIDDIEGISILFACQIRELENGNLLIGNYTGHAKDKTQSKLFEIDRKNKKLIWKLGDDVPVKNVTGTYIIK